VKSLYSIDIHFIAARFTGRSLRSVTPFRWVSSVSCTAWCYIVWGTARHRRPWRRHGPLRGRRRRPGSQHVRQVTATRRPRAARSRQNVSPDSSWSSSSSSPCLGSRHR